MAEDSIEEFVRPFFENPHLYPMVGIVVVVVATFGAWLLSSVVRFGSVAALAAVVLLLLMTLDLVRKEWQRRGRPGRASALIGAVWFLSIAGALAGLRSGLL